MTCCHYKPGASAGQAAHGIQSEDVQQYLGQAAWKEGSGAAGIGTEAAKAAGTGGASLCGCA